MFLLGRVPAGREAAPFIVRRAHAVACGSIPPMRSGLSSFVGRETESSRLGEWVAAHRMVSVVGPGGIGKTRLSHEAAAPLAARFPGGVHRSELAQLSARDDVASEVAGALGYASLEALVLRLGDAPALLVLDNCEHLLDAVAQLCRRLLADAPSLHLLATSRERLGVDGEQVLVLGPLEADAAARLFEDRARSAGARLEASAAEAAARAELCRRLDGIPLAIELAAARARSLTAAETLALLGRRFDLLKGAAPVGLSRHTSLRAAIDASYELLDPSEQAFFRALGAFAGAFTAQLAHAVAGPESSDLLRSIDALSALVDRSLLVAETAGGVTRYRLLDSLRDYAAERARDAGESERHADRFVEAMAEEARSVIVAGTTRWTAELLSRVLLHFDALVAAVERTVQTDADARRAFLLLLPLWAAIHQGRAREVADLAERVLARWPTGNEPLRAEATAAAASALLASARIPEATERAQAVVDAPAAAPLARVLALRTLGIAAQHRGGATVAAGHARRASEIAGAAGLASFERELRVFAASTAPEGEPIESALAALEDVAKRAAADGDSIGEVWARVVATHVLIRIGRLPEAREALAVARQAQQGFDYPYGAKAVLRLTATLDALDRGWEHSRAAWLASIEACAHSGDLAEFALALRTAAALAARAGDRDAAEALLAAVPSGDHAVILGLLFEVGGGIARGAPSAPGAALRCIRERLRAEPAAAPARVAPVLPTAPPRTGSLRREGDVWEIAFAGHTTRVRHTKGVDDLATLLARPDAEVHCLELMGGADVGGEAGPLVDGRARAAYQARIRALQETIDEAQGANDLGRAERAEAELDALVSQLSEAFGLGGRARATGSAAERARSAVAWRLRSVLKRIDALHPELGRHLSHAIRTGVWCSYRPESPVRWDVDAGRRSA
jgi:predicted ATPase